MARTRRRPTARRWRPPSCRARRLLSRPSAICWPNNANNNRETSTDVAEEETDSTELHVAVLSVQYEFYPLKSGCHMRRNSVMAVEIVLPRLGWTMEEGIFVQWLKQDGELVQAG